MKAKTFEIRDRMTFIPVLAVRLDPECEADRYLFSRAGYSADPVQQGSYVLLIRITGGNGQSSCDPYDWGSRTMSVAHQHVLANWETLESGAVIDVEFLMSETPAPKPSESTEVA